MKNKYLPKFINAYLARNPLTYKLELFPDSCLKDSYSLAIVIPVLAESEVLPATLDSLLCSFESLKKKAFHALLILVVNNPALRKKDSAYFNEAKKRFDDNQYLLNSLRDNSFCITHGLLFKKYNIDLCWIDASSKGHEIDRKQGVGGGRKVGMDAALNFLNWKQDPLIFSLDADTLVQKNYISVVRDFFDINPNISGATIDFLHQKGANIYEEKAIRLYESYIHNYADSLRFTETPYSYYSIGSAIVARASAYTKAGGMRPKPAGEDFYFLQALCKIAQQHSKYPIGKITETCVFPSSRLSNRVPFGTGPKMLELIDNIKKAENGETEKQADEIFYNPKIFLIIKKIISEVSNGTLEQSYDTWFAGLPKEAQDFLNCYKFQVAWSKIRENTPDDSRKIEIAFHTWFDAFKILKFIHFCEKQPYCLNKTKLAQD